MKKTYTKPQLDITACAYDNLLSSTVIVASETGKTILESGGDEEEDYKEIVPDQSGWIDGW